MDYPQEMLIFHKAGSMQQPAIIITAGEFQYLMRLFAGFAPETRWATALKRTFVLKKDEIQLDGDRWERKY